MDTAQALAEICPPPASPTAPSPLVPSFDSPERARPAILLPLSPDLTPVSSQKMSSQTSSFTGWGVPCSSQQSSSTLKERRKKTLSKNRRHPAADEEERFWRGPEESRRNDLANLLNFSSESPLSSAPVSPVFTNAKLPGDSTGTATEVQDFVHSVLQPDKVPRRTQRYQDLVGNRRGPESPNCSAPQQFSVLQLEQAPASVSGSPNTNNPGCGQYAGTTIPKDRTGRLENGELYSTQQSKVARDNVPSRQEDIIAATPTPIETAGRSLAVAGAALDAGIPSILPDTMEIDPDGDLESAGATVDPLSKGLAGSKEVSQEPTASRTKSFHSQSSSTTGGSLFTSPPAVTKSRALIDDILSGPPKKKTKTTDSTRSSSSGCPSTSGSSTPVNTSSATSELGSTSGQTTPSRTTIARLSLSTLKTGSSSKQPSSDIIRDKRARPSWKSQADSQPVSVGSPSLNVTSGKNHPAPIAIPRLRIRVSPPVEAERATGNHRAGSASTSTTSDLADNSKSLTTKSNPILTTVSIAADPGRSTTGTVSKFLLRKTPSAGSMTPARTTTSTNPIPARSTPSNEKEIDPLDSQEVDESVPVDVLRAVQLMERRIVFKNVPSLDQHQAGEKRKRLAF